jgi:hypothetical protein
MAPSVHPPVTEVLRLINIQLAFVNTNMNVSIKRNLT